MKMMMKMMKTMSQCLLLLGLAVTYTAAGPGSCVGRCGESFIRGQQCNCDFSCLQHNECCPDYQAICTSVQSCQGRCGETFKRGKVCECDAQCINYNTCCNDYKLQCDVPQPRTYQSVRAPASGSRKLERSRKRLNSDSEEWYTGRHRCAQYPGAQCVLTPVPVPAKQLQHGVPSLSNRAAGGNVNVHVVLSPGGVAPSGPSQGLCDDPELCNESPINGITALINGTILIFKGELCWSVDPVTRSVGHPRSITDTLGISAPIDTVFTRANCQGNTYIIKGDQCWLLDANMVMEPGYPKPVASEFPGLRGSIRAALAVPATRSRPETVYFFKKGDVMQRFSFPSSSIPDCSNTPRGSYQRRFDHPTEVLLSGEIKLKVSLKELPAPVTSAMSTLSPGWTDRYEHYVFSGPLFFSVQVSGTLPALTKPEPTAVFSPIVSPPVAAPYPAPPPNSIRVWLHCP
ncbi:Proteoglycan 4 Lubricin Megakaryocyte-stimulating factor [Larimichthys crocea]|uniref:Proteoglycan 4 Lubricin Megakaryocyte-stimulating factor n=1 Tax=Larimichthys crocea TaxID=215358 RepID=A0A6G0IIM9_LARCR|nr:Proteoglycan 4 Lubricin Megakaryocyte-stimulating factor [Larimichthys crocea]